MNDPKITVLMPVFNAEKYLEEAIESVLNQTFSDFEFLIFNDGSTDRSAKVVRRFTDSRIRFFDSHENYGYVHHLNHGICIARGRYIARMDADDVSHPERFEKQIHFMDANPDVGVCGTWFDIIGDSQHVIKHPSDDQEIRVSLLNNSALGHPTVLMRAEVLRKNNLVYDESLVPAEDYNLWTIIGRYSKLANLPQVLLHYRLHEGQISSRKYELQRQNAQVTRDTLIEMLMGRALNVEEVLWNALLFDSGDRLLTLEGLSYTEKWKTELTLTNIKVAIYPQHKFSQLLNYKTCELRSKYFSQKFISPSTYSLKLLIEFLASDPLAFLHVGKKKLLIFLLKCIFHYQPQEQFTPFN